MGNTSIGTTGSDIGMYVFIRLFVSLFLCLFVYLFLPTNFNSQHYCVPYLSIRILITQQHPDDGCNPVYGSSTRLMKLVTHKMTTVESNTCLE